MQILQENVMQSRNFLKTELQLVKEAQSSDNSNEAHLTIFFLNKPEGQFVCRSPVKVFFLFSFFKLRIIIKV